MSLVQTETKIDPQVLGNLMLHCRSFNDMPKPDWLAKFPDLQTTEYVLADQAGEFFGMMPPDTADKARDALMEHIENLQGGGTLIAEGPVQEMPFTGKSPTMANIQTLPHREPPVGQPAASVGIISGAETIDTDKGTFYHLESLENKLAAIYVKADVVANFDTSFLKAMVVAKIEPGMDYISESKKKALTKELTTLMMEGV